MTARSPSSSNTVIGIVVVILLLAGLVWAVAASRSSLGDEKARRVTFRVESSGGYANITLKAGSVKIEEPETFTTPWEKTVSVERAESVYLTASNPTQTGQLTCEIILDRKVWKSDTIPAPKDGVACAGIIP